MAENTGLATLDIRGAMSADGPSAYCSLKAGTMKEKAILYNATSNPEHKVGDFINKLIWVKDIYVEAIEIADTDDNGNPIKDENGEDKTTVVPRIVLIDKDNKAYQAVSKGVMNALVRMIRIYGEPTWSDGLPCIVKQVSFGKNQMLTLDVDVSQF